MIYGYARVSTNIQSNESQIKQLEENGCETIYSEVFTRRSTDRPELNKLLSRMKSGDTLVVTKLDRLAGNTREILVLTESLFVRDIKLNILNLGLIDNSTTGKLIFTVLSAFAEFEVDLIKTRMREGKEYARLNPNFKDGRPVKYGTEKRKLALQLLKKHSYKEVSRMTGMSKSTLQRIKQNGL